MVHHAPHGSTGMTIMARQPNKVQFRDTGFLPILGGDLITVSLHAVSCSENSHQGSLLPDRYQLECRSRGDIRDMAVWGK
jgi:hypothetical protein